LYFKVATIGDTMVNNYFTKYNFNPFQFSGNERASRYFHNLMVRYFDKCTNVLDLGCGKGEFLQALKGSGKSGFGIDSFDEAVQHCLSKNLIAEKWEVRDYLLREENNLTNYDGVYCAHLIEHLLPEAVFELFALLFAVTKPGTKFVFVTPNFDDLAVSGSIFWMDLTHIRPYPGLLVQRMLDSVGFRETSHSSIYGLGLDKSILKNYLIQKIRFGDKIYKPNTIVTAIR
jgi:O-antigen chain-terminating methyltransferase